MNKRTRKQFALNQSPLGTVQGKAFTLIELLVVIAIIGILSALIVVGMSSTTQKATIAKAQVFSNSLRNSLMGNLVSEWRLDENANPSANRTPDTWGTNTGILGDGATATTFPTLVSTESSCVSGKCFGFDGGDYVNCGNASTLNFLAPITISAWIKTSIGSSQMIVGKEIDATHKDWQFEIFPTGLLGFEGSAFHRIGTTNLADGNWKQVVTTMTAAGSTNVRLYVNGIEEVYTQTGSTGDLGSNLALAFIGARYTTPVNHFNGLIDEVRIFNAAMPTSQIQQNYFIGLNKLFAKNQITQSDYQQRLADLATSFAKH